MYSSQARQARPCRFQIVLVTGTCVYMPYVAFETGWQPLAVGLGRGEG